MRHQGSNPWPSATKMITPDLEKALQKMLRRGFVKHDLYGNLTMWTGNDWRETTVKDIVRDTLRIEVEVIEHELSNADR